MISIIVPIYNVEQYIEACLDSVLNSTYQDFELILVDDGSTDKSGLICDQYRERDNRIRVVHQANSGTSAARNTALDIARGDFISFVDGDDIIHPMMLEVLKTALDSSDYDFSMIHYLEVDESEKDVALEECKKMPSRESQVLTQDGFMKGLIDNSLSSVKYNLCTNKLYKKSLIKNLRFLKTAIEDMEFNFRVTMNMKNKKAIIVNDKLYYWIIRNTSQCHEGIGRRYVERIHSYYLCYKDIPEEMAYFKARCLDMLYKVMVYTYYDTKLKGDKELMQRCKDLRSFIYKETKSDFMKCGLRSSKKLLLMLLFNMPIIYPVFKTVFEMKSKLS